MGIGIEFILVVILAFISLITIYDFFEMFFDNKYKYKTSIKVISYIVLLMLNIFLYYYKQTTITNIISNFSCLMLITSFYDSKFMDKFFAKFSIIVLMVSVDIIINYIFSLFMGKPINLILDNQDYFLKISALTRLIPFTLIKLYKLYYNKNNDYHKKEINLNFGDLIIILIVPMLSILLMIIIFNENEVMNLNNVLSIIIILILNIIFYQIYSKIQTIGYVRTNALILEKQISHYNIEYEKLTKQLNENLIIKHDLKHNIINILSKIEVHDNIEYDDTTNEIDEIINQIFKTDFKQYTNNPSIDMILNHQINIAESLDIKVNLNIKLKSKSTINIDGRVLCIVIGNALENAIEVCEKQNDKEINLSILQQNSNLYLDISNKYQNEMVMSDGLPLTRKSDKELHGLGLRSIKKIVTESGGYLDINIDNNIFNLKILL